MTGLYIHIPFCKQKCAYCDFPSFAGRERDAGRYFSALIHEAELWAEKLRFCSRSALTPNPLPHRNGEGGLARYGGFAPNPPVGAGPCTRPSISEPNHEKVIFQTIFLGGGTPSLLPAGELERLMDRLRLILNITPIEFTVEANPGTVDRAKLDSFRRMGADRISFGVQAAQDALLRRIGRIHTWADFVRSYELAREAGFTNINADMMTGLPGQTADDAVETAAMLAALGVEHVSCYGLIVEESTPLAQAISKGDEVPPGDDEERGMFHAAQEVFKGAGIKRYEISNFAKPGFECRHNLNYWHNGNWLGLGLGAASHFSGARRENHTDLDAYISALESGVLPPAEEHIIGPDEAVFETIMLELRLIEGMDFGRFRERHGFEFLSKYQKQTEKLVKDGLLQRTPDGVALTEKGLDLQNTVLMEFMD